jgi:hypothetical protein
MAQRNVDKVFQDLVSSQQAIEKLSDEQLTADRAHAKAIAAHRKAGTGKEFLSVLSAYSKANRTRGQKLQKEYDRRDALEREMTALFKA